MARASKSVVRGLWNRIHALTAEYETCDTMAMRRCVATTLETVLMQLSDSTGSAPSIDEVL